MSDEEQKRYREMHIQSRRAYDKEYQEFEDLRAKTNRSDDHLMETIKHRRDQKALEKRKERPTQPICRAHQQETEFPRPLRNS